MDCVCLLALILQAWKGVTARVPSKLPHQRLIQPLLDFNMKADNLAVCFCLGWCLVGLTWEGSAVFWLRVTWQFDLSKLSLVVAGSLSACDWTSTSLNYGTCDTKTMVINIPLYPHLSNLNFTTWFKKKKKRFHNFEKKKFTTLRLQLNSMTIYS